METQVASLDLHALEFNEENREHVLFTEKLIK